MRELAAIDGRRESRWRLDNGVLLVLSQLLPLVVDEVVVGSLVLNCARSLFFLGHGKIAVGRLIAGLALPHVVDFLLGEVTLRAEGGTGATLRT